MVAVVAEDQHRLSRDHRDAIHHPRTWLVTRCGQRPGRVRWTTDIKMINCEDCLAELEPLSESGDQVELPVPVAANLTRCGAGGPGAGHRGRRRSGGPVEPSRNCTGYPGLPAPASLKHYSCELLLPL